MLTDGTGIFVCIFKKLCYYEEKPALHKWTRVEEEERCIRYEEGSTTGRDHPTVAKAIGS